MFAVQVPIAGLALMPLALGLPILFGPIHIAFIEMVIDPVCSLVFEAESEEEDVMRRQPRPQSASMAPASLIAWSLFQGLFAFSIVAGVLFVGLRRGMPVDEVRALTFFALVLTSVGLILAHRAFSAFGRDGIAPSQPSPRLDLATVAVILGLALLWPFATDLFRFGPLHLDDLALTVAAGVVVFTCLEVIKFVRGAWSGR